MYSFLTQTGVAMALGSGSDSPACGIPLRHCTPHQSLDLRGQRRHCRLSWSLRPGNCAWRQALLLSKLLQLRQEEGLVYLTQP